MPYCKILALPLTLLFSLSASAQSAADRVLTERRPAVGEERKPSIGLILGAPNAQGATGGRGASLEFATQPEIPISTAVELGVSLSDEVNKQTLTRTKLMLKAHYNLAGDIPVIRYSYLGLALGPVWDNQNNQSVINIGGGPELGFDIPVSRWSAAKPVWD